MAVNLSQIKDLLLPGLRGVEGGGSTTCIAVKPRVSVCSTCFITDVWETGVDRLCHSLSGNVLLYCESGSGASLDARDGV